MTDKIKLAVNWAAACGGCDVSLLDIEAQLLELASVADIVFWPVALDHKRSDLQAMAPDEIDIGIFNGAIRTTEHEEDARLLRSRCQVLIAFGACAAFGGIPGLANLSSQQALLDTVYRDTPSTDNPLSLYPETTTTLATGETLTLPALRGSVSSLSQVVEVDYVVPGCPPPMARVLEATQLITAHARGEELPPRGTVLASSKALCDECVRNESRTGGRISAIRRPHQVAADPERCFLDQGLLCLGIATRGGCGSTCIDANMPCRGCFGPTEEVLDPAAEALSAIASLLAYEHEDLVPASRRLAPVRTLADPAGTCYRFTLPSATIPGAVNDTPKEQEGE